MLSRNSETRSTYYIFLCCYAFGIAFAYFLDVVALFVCCFVLFLCMWFEPREIVLTTYFTYFKSLLNDDAAYQTCVYCRYWCTLKSEQFFELIIRMNLRATPNETSEIYSLFAIAFNYFSLLEIWRQNKGREKTNTHT